ncbi:arylsulfatase A-like [Eriocheir sinensis]|uniref:arylsulfatase A-like n=1 Tax=Eriocheir sinensis TaxID=95602 RepID=UPI0021C84716|nr:arylsulfatase A-like [Eriocheir sinensis]XP_050712449.1 arylsulfatase A-like [Eriocheir sinensis]
MGVTMKVLLCAVCCLLVVYAECEVVNSEPSRSRETFKETPDVGMVKDEESRKALETEKYVEDKMVNEALGKGKITKKDKSAESPPPNIVVLLADDLGYGDLSFSGHPTSKTPHIDKLARESRFFTHHYVTSPVCSPSRASLLTGRLQVRSGVYPGTFVPKNPLGMPRNETTIAALLKAKGYRTMITGKWHLGVGRDGEYLPTHFGFDHYLGVPYSHDMCPCLTCFPGPKPCYDTCWSDRVSCPLFSNTTIIEQPVDLLTLTQRFIDNATAFINESATANAPFFLYFPFHHVHHPQFASEMFAGKSDRGFIGDALEELDWAVSQVVATLQAHDLLNSTLIWFSSDNGPSLYRRERGGCAGMLRCGKGTTWEGGVRVPMFVHWPPHITPGRSHGLVSALDLLPTVSSLVGLNTSALTLDGTDISSLLWDPLAPSPRQHMPIYPESPTPSVGPLAVTNGTYKAHFYTRGSDLSDPDNYDEMCPGAHPLTQHVPPLLYHIRRDPGERYDLSGDSQYSGVISDLTAWREEHMKAMTWNDPLTEPLDPYAQPCCTSPSCTPFPQCCDCPTTSSSTPAAAPHPLLAPPQSHPNAIASIMLH